MEEEERRRERMVNKLDDTERWKEHGRTPPLSILQITDSIHQATCIDTLGACIQYSVSMATREE